MFARGTKTTLGAERDTNRSFIDFSLTILYGHIEGWSSEAIKRILRPDYLYHLDEITQVRLNPGNWPVLTILTSETRNSDRLQSMNTQEFSNYRGSAPHCRIGT